MMRPPSVQLILSRLKWGATVAQIVGVFTLSSRVAPAELAFAIMLLGSGAWVVVAWAMAEWSMVALNLAFTASNLLGLWRWSL